ncbi:MAG TPA: hypothetical protein VFM69_08050 [Pricia sp.]|nr:hypothetical protein [Pricia sp.]
MNTTKPFYSHEPDGRIMIKKDKAEVRNWTADLEYVNEELEYLLDIEDSMLNNPELYRQLRSLQRENQLKLGALYRYDGSMGNAIECDTTECDAYYLHNHEKNRTIYTAHVHTYRELKKRVLSKILLNAKN